MELEINGLNISITTLIIAIIIAVVALILLVFGIILLVKKSNKKVSKVSYSNEQFKNLVSALGNIENITSVIKEHQRIKVVLNDPKMIDSSALKSMGISAFLVGKELKMLVKENANQIYQLLIQEKSEDKK